MGLLDRLYIIDGRKPADKTSHFFNRVVDFFFFPVRQFLSHKKITAAINSAGDIEHTLAKPVLMPPSRTRRGRAVLAFTVFLPLTILASFFGAIAKGVSYLVTEKNLYKSPLYSSAPPSSSRLIGMKVVSPAPNPRKRKADCIQSNNKRQKAEALLDMQEDAENAIENSIKEHLKQLVNNLSHDLDFGNYLNESVEDFWRYIEGLEGREMDRRDFFPKSMASYNALMDLTKEMPGGVAKNHLRVIAEMKSAVVAPYNDMARIRRALEATIPSRQIAAAEARVGIDYESDISSEGYYTKFSRALSDVQKEEKAQGAEQAQLPLPRLAKHG